MAINVPDNSYITIEDARTYADAMSLDLPADDVELEALLKRSAITLDRNYGASYIGNRTSTTYSLYWPRTVLNYYDSLGNYRTDLTYTSIPYELGQAQVELCALLNAGDFDAYAQPAPVITEKLAELEGLKTQVKYAAPSANLEGYSVNEWYKIDLVLAPLLRTAGGNSKTITMTRGG